MVVFDEDKVRMQCNTLELPDLGNQQNVSCIPEGKYDVAKIYSPKKGMSFLLYDVPGRSSIMIHKGNYNSDTQGCILPGYGFEDINDDGNLDVIGSTATMNKLLNIMPNEFILYII
jgi:hypothetical protein